MISEKKNVIENKFQITFLSDNTTYDYTYLIRKSHSSDKKDTYKLQIAYLLTLIGYK